MNVVFISPHFPPNFYLFCMGLKRLGVNVLGIGDTSYQELSDELKWALTDYQAIPNMEDYGAMWHVCRYFTDRYGQIDRIDSHNEHWLEMEAQLRTDFDIFGLKLDGIQDVRNKSQMKQKFIEAGIRVARGEIICDWQQAQQFIAEVGYPVIAKPDKGVGAAGTYKIHDDQELAQFFAEKNHQSYIMEEFVNGYICSFDGLIDRAGELAFYTVHQNCDNVMEILHEDRHTAYFSLRDLPEDIVEAGFRILTAVGARERFFHVEFFRLYDGGLVALEINMRPPGGLSIDMFNYANDIDLYQEWGNLLVHNHFSAQYHRPYHCAYISRKNSKNYLYSHREILERYHPWIVHHTQLHPMFWQVMGNYGYLVRDPQLEKIFEIKDFIHHPAW